MSDNYGNLERRVETVEEAVLILKELALSTNERLNGFDAALNNLTVKVEALTDAQIRTEESLKALAGKVETLADAQIRINKALARMADAQNRTDEALVRMADAQAHTDQRLDALIDIVRGRDGQ